MNQSNFGEKYGVGQYRFPHAYDLAGKTFAFGDKTISFVSRTELLFCGVQSAYEALKIEKDTYFVSFGDSAAVIDESCGRALFITPDGYDFCGDGKWTFTDNMTGTGIRWYLGSEKYTDHIYFAPDKARVSWSPLAEDYGVFPAKYTFIKDGIYLVDIAAEVPSGVCAPEGYDRALFLEDYEHVMLVGCLMGKGVSPIAVSGYGKFVDFEASLFV